jgi:ATP/ADP translocase
VKADPADCSFQFNPTGTVKFTNSCDIAKAFLARNAVSYTTEAAPAGSTATIIVGTTAVESFDLEKAGAEGAAKTAAFNRAAGAAITAAGYPSATDPNRVRVSGFFDIFRSQPLTIIAILTVLVIYVTMVYGPIAAALVELFPTRIRYTSMSLPYHIGNGWFGGLLPATSFAMVAQTGDIYYGLWYPIVVALGTAVIGFLFVPETKDRDIFTYDGNK